MKREPWDKCDNFAVTELGAMCAELMSDGSVLAYFGEGEFELIPPGGLADDHKPRQKTRAQIERGRRKRAKRLAKAAAKREGRPVR